MKRQGKILSNSFTILVPRLYLGTQITIRIFLLISIVFALFSCSTIHSYPNGDFYAIVVSDTHVSRDESKIERLNKLSGMIEVIWERETGFKPYYSFDHEGWRFVVLNTMRGRYLYRNFDDEQMAWLENTLFDVIKVYETNSFGDEDELMYYMVGFDSLKREITVAKNVVPEISKLYAMQFISKD